MAGLAMGAGICLMHYVGMAALQSSASFTYKPGFVAAAFGISVLASTAALLTARTDRSLGVSLAASVLLGLAVVGMHYTAMAGLQVTMGRMGAVPLGAPPFILGFAVSAGSFVILGLALLASLYDQRISVLAALEAGSVGYWELELPGRVLQVSAQGKRIFGCDPAQPFTYQDLVAALPPHDLARREDMLRRAIETGEDYDIEYRLPSSKPSWVNVRGRVVAARNGAARRMAGVVLEVTERREAMERVVVAERQQRVMIDELNHRVKNTLSTIQSIARQTRKRATSLEEFGDAFEARLLSLSNTHNVLTRGLWEQASLRELLQTEFAPYAKEQVRLEGLEVELSPKQALAIGMIMHELTTNAAKHGALSRVDGCVRIAWSVLADRLTLEWTEEDGPEVVRPSAAGFGTSLIAAMARELRGTAELCYLRPGVRCKIDIPMQTW